MEFLKIENIKDAEKAMQEIEVSSEGIELMKGKLVHKIVRLRDVDVKAVNILKQQMLSLGGEVACSKQASMLEGEKTDAILMGTLKQFELLISNLEKQPFGLKELGEKLSIILKDK